MTEFDKTLIKKANEEFGRFEIDMIDSLIRIADTAEARIQLGRLQSELDELRQEAI